MRLSHKVSILLTASLAIVNATVISFSDHNVNSLKDSIPLTEWLVIFYADWCGACRMLKPVFHQFAADSITQFPHLRFAAINYVDSPVTIMRFGISSLPSIYHIRHGEYRDISDYRQNLTRYFDEESWKSVPPVTTWMQPFSAFGNIIAFMGSIGIYIVTSVSRLQSLSTWQLALLILLLPLGLISFALAIALVRRWFEPRDANHLSDEKKDQ